MRTLGTIDQRAARAYLARRTEELEAVIDKVPVFSKRYHAAVDELEEIEEMTGAGSSP